MAWMPLGDAVARLLGRLDARLREEKAGGIDAPRKCARAEGLGYPARGDKGAGSTKPPAKVQRDMANALGGKLGCDVGTRKGVALRQRGKIKARDTGRTVGQGKFRRTKL